MPRPPFSFQSAIGQARPARHIQRSIHDAKRRAEPLCSMIVTGAYGMGKSAFARATAREWYGSDRPLTELSARSSPVELVEVLERVEHADILLIDEADGLDPVCTDVLKAALDKQIVPRVAQGRLDHRQTQSIATFTLLLATHSPGKIARDLRDRLETVELDPYTTPELRAIAVHVAREHFQVHITPQAATHLVARSQRTPRSVCKLVAAAARRVDRGASVGQDIVLDALADLGVDEHGFWPRQREYLQLLANAYPSAMSPQVIAARLRVDATHIRTDIEPFLLERQLLDITATRHRRLTADGLALIRPAVLAAKKAEAEHRNHDQDRDHDQDQRLNDFEATTLSN